MKSVKSSPLYILLLLMFFSINSFAQKKKMSPEVYKIWNKIEQTSIADNGQHVAYVLNKEVGNPLLKLYTVVSDNTTTIERSTNPQFDQTGNFLLYRIKPDYDSVRLQKLAEVKKDDLPPDTLGIMNLENHQIHKIPHLESFTLPEKWGHHAMIEVKDPGAKDKKKNRTLLVKNLMTGRTDTLAGVKEYTIPEEAMGLIVASAGKDSTLSPGLYNYDFQDQSFQPYFIAEGEFPQMAFSKNGTQLAFIADLDTTENEIRPFSLYHAQFPNKPTLVLDAVSEMIPAGFQVSSYRQPSWSDDYTTMYFGMSVIPLVEDTTTLEEERPKVEVWTTEDPVLYTMQELRKNRDQRKNYLTALQIGSLISGTPSITHLENEYLDDVSLPAYGNSEHLLGIHDRSYQKQITWLGYPYNDVYVVNAASGQAQKIASAVNGNTRLSPAGKYAYWFDRELQHYFTIDLDNQEMKNITDQITPPLGDELNDRPMYAGEYGIAGWSEMDDYILVYDRYDIWKVDPSGQEAPVKLTEGRSIKQEARYVRIDREEKFIDLKKDLLLRIFNESDKSSGYAYLKIDGSLDIKIQGDYAYSRNVWKAKNSSEIVYTKENFQIFPDLILSNSGFSGETQISEANPQQAEYLWGNGEIYTWQDSAGNEMTGMLFKPEDFNPAKKYPLLINFYEKSSNRLHSHRAPFAGRSTISYSYYLSQGYVIFNPDIFYTIGYPGKSALQAVNTGLDALLKEGYIDEAKVGLQGHSWGGYQIAHILTKTDRFACAEAGAPVVNMTSAYGGIRWGSGMSRMFQYEKTQSRLGGTIWERPDLYLENSPLFNIDKMNTPVLILHNDTDGAVPWYQGIEYYMALRRLGKPGWFLNYNGEPHWPLKWPNRLDFNIRMEQFFAHFLLDQPMPKWMKNGISELEKGKRWGYETGEK